MYRIFYNDGSYLDYKLTDQDWYDVKAHIIREDTGVFISIGFLSLKDIRSIIELPEPIQDDPNQGLPPDLTPQDRAWLNAHREEANDDDDIDY